MGLRLFAALLPIIALAIPLLELVGIYQIWQWLGWWTLAYLGLAVLAGMGLLMLERVAFLPRMALSMMNGETPFSVLTESGLRFLAGGLLIFPGPVTDGMALVLLVISLFVAGAPVAKGHRAAANDDVIEGDYRRVD